MSRVIARRPLTLLRLAAVISPLVAVGVIANPSGVSAFWTNRSIGHGHVRIAKLTAPGDVDVKVDRDGQRTHRNTIAVSWKAVLPPTKHAHDETFYVQRMDVKNWTIVAACGTSPIHLMSAATHPACDDGNLPPGTYAFRVVAVFRSWTAISKPSPTVTVKRGPHDDDVTTVTPTVDPAVTAAILAPDTSMIVPRPANVPPTHVTSANPAPLITRSPSPSPSVAALSRVFPPRSAN